MTAPSSAAPPVPAVPTLLVRRGEWLLPKATVPANSLLGRIPLLCVYVRKADLAHAWIDLIVFHMTRSIQPSLLDGSVRQFDSISLPGDWLALRVPQVDFYPTVLILCCGWWRGLFFCLPGYRQFRGAAPAPEAVRPEDPELAAHQLRGNQLEHFLRIRRHCRGVCTGKQTAEGSQVD